MTVPTLHVPHKDWGYGWVDAASDADRAEAERQYLANILAMQRWALVINCPAYGGNDWTKMPWHRAAETWTADNAKANYVSLERWALYVCEPLHVPFKEWGFDEELDPGKEVANWRAVEEWAAQVFRCCQSWYIQTEKPSDVYTFNATSGATTPWTFDVPAVGQTLTTTLDMVGEWTKVPLTVKKNGVALETFVVHVGTFGQTVSLPFVTTDDITFTYDFPTFGTAVTNIKLLGFDHRILTTAPLSTQVPNNAYMAFAISGEVVLQQEFPLAVNMDHTYHIDINRDITSSDVLRWWVGLSDAGLGVFQSTCPKMYLEITVDGPLHVNVAASDGSLFTALAIVDPLTVEVDIAALDGVGTGRWAGVPSNTYAFAALTSVGAPTWTINDLEARLDFAGLHDPVLVPWV